jgi:hypothetical protein
MTPPSPSIPTSPTASAVPILPETNPPVRPAESASTSPRPSTPPFNQLEIQAGGRYGIADRFQLELAISYRPIRELSFGVFGQWSPVSQGGASLQGGYRFSITDVLSIQPTLFGGFNFQDHISRTVGSLQETVSLTGVSLYAGLEARFIIQPTNWLGIYISPGLIIQGPVDVHSDPSQLMSRENPVGGIDVIPTISLGLTFGAVPSARAPEVDAASTSARSTPPPLPTAPEAPTPDFEERVRSQVTEITAGMEHDRAERVEQVIGDVRSRITRARTSIGHLNRGINRTNQMAWLFVQVADRLAADPATTVTAEERQGLGQQLDALLAATELDARHEPVSLTEESEDIRTGLRFINSTTTARYAFGRAILNHLTTLRTQLQQHHETEAVGRVDQAINRVTDYLNHFSEGIRASDLQREVESIDQSMGLVQSLESDYHLDTNETWRSLHEQLRTVQEEVAQTVRAADALGNFAFLLQGTSNNFGNQVRSPADAEGNLHEALQFLQQMTTTPRFQGVTVADLRSRFGYYFGFISYNLNRFIELHTPPP